MIALIPARKNSKRFPRKNHASFEGVSLIERTVVCAKESRLFSEIYISTDDLELAKKAERLGVMVPYVRPANLSEDDTPSWDVVKHFTTELAYEGDLALLQLTSPLREASDLRELAQKFRSEPSSPLGLTVRLAGPSETLQDHWLCPHGNLVTSHAHCHLASRVVASGACYLASSPNYETVQASDLTGQVGHLVPADRSLDIDYEHQLHR